MSRIVADEKTRKDRQGILTKIKKWEKLRLQPNSIISRKILVQILNGIWTAYRRKQKSEQATIWIAAESYPRDMSPTLYMDLAKRLCTLHFPLITSLGYEIDIVEDNETYVLYRSRRSRGTDHVVLLGVEIKNTHIEEALRVRHLLFRETKLLPESFRKKSWKKKRRKKKVSK